MSRLVNFGMNIASIVWTPGYLGEIVNFALPVLQSPWLAWGPIYTKTTGTPTPRMLQCFYALLTACCTLATYQVNVSP